MIHFHNRSARITAIHNITKRKLAEQELQKAMHEVSSSMYGQQGTGGPNQQGQQSQPGHEQKYQQYQNATNPDDAVDVDYEVG